ncbi:DUF3093 domain-containing protein [Streptomyces alfalfae]|uniref:DUF3093 domain-containing protein n=1 Tax=Streptomyces alfalfae TaxID=1642299 RepID=A0ABM6H1Z1_9ACTN|nr:DUF3093 family protein [Streptomyces alfalfae]AYA20204.1 DUF3093 domain-containing protein [Streptomyces fradiae]APY89755.1 hypothetical protein A7J05_32340 [Streptomyces alfalfae]QUI30194.1 DUF3093 domain-containing protein [Streptomyces alfalfae]RXX43695.1 DUF3093 domain-containing protein [Streptomyces alfalfae]RZM87504.1 DUF3093 domain-containing protein [Streptomyces alfalfae]
MHIYEERLSVPRSWWALVALGGAGLALAGIPFGVIAAVTAAAVGMAVAAGIVYAHGRVRILVTPGSLVVGGRKIPIEALGATEILDEREAFEWRTVRANPYAMLLLRSYIPTALRIELRNSYGGAPYLYLSTRQPMNLAAVLAFSRG